MVVKVRLRTFAHNNMKRFLYLLLLLLLPASVSAQRILDGQGRSMSMNTDDGNGSSHFSKSEDKYKKEKKIPTGLRVWTVNEWNERASVAIDTFSHAFQNSNFTDGPTGRYTTLGNMGSPRLSRWMVDRPMEMSYFIFSEPYDFFIRPFNSIHFTNTLAPITNATYHETTSSDNGEDRFTAKFAVNANKQIGFGFHLDYLYGRGYYNHQNTSQLGFTLYGSILKERYQAHLSLYSNYLKTAENGGIEDDDYIDHPENFPSKFGTKDIPTRINYAWNKMYVDGAQLTHSYSIGFHKTVPLPKDTARHTPSAPSAEQVVRPATIIINKAGDTIQLDSSGAKISASFAAVNASVHRDTLKTDTSIFVPVTSFIHTLKLSYNQKKFLANEHLNSFYTNDYLSGDSAKDVYGYTAVSNMLAIELREGFNKWALAGIRLFAQHDFNHYSIPLTAVTTEGYNENRITLGGMLFRHQSKTFRYNLLAQTSSDGNSFGEFKLHADANLHFRLFGDSIDFSAHATAVNQQPTFYYRHMQGKYLWWDNSSLDKQMTTRIGAVLTSRKTHTRLAFDVENIKKYTFFYSTLTPTTDDNGNEYTTMATSVRQAGDNIQLLSLSLNQDFTFGIFNWENELAYQATSDKRIFPLPAFSAYTNLYILFHVAKVLRVELGADLRYFTQYYAPTYDPALGMYANQDVDHLIKVGNHPIVNVYANFHLKHTRFYVMYSHVNYSNDGGSGFAAPHYPVNPGMLKLGLSWNFFN